MNAFKVKRKKGSRKQCFAGGVSALGQLWFSREQLTWCIIFIPSRFAT